ncbi:MAG TPA: flagellar basal body-associated FliL family protein, partial [Paracoccaceae bacterium]
APADAEPAAHAAPGPLPDIAFVPVDPLVISLGSAGTSSHLRMASQLEVAKPHAAEVALLMPRILDVLNSYLRAVEVAQLEDPTALVRLRSQMLRRIQIVTGEGRVRDLLITEFVLN